MELEMVLNDQERLNLEQFLEDHGHCEGHGLTLVQNNGSGIGVATQVSCPCGEERDLTDYSVW